MSFIVTSLPKPSSSMVSPFTRKFQIRSFEYATNTNSVVFVFTPTQQFYYLTAGRWFQTTDLQQGPWTYATPDLPPDFAKIPLSSPASAILASVPGTEEAKDAVLLAQVPTTMTVNSKEAAAKVKVEYAGDPKFEPIKGTSMEYAANTPDKVIKVGDVYYLCLQGVWFMSPNPAGPWTTCTSVPQEIYTIPSSSPVYNVTYVTQTGNPDGTVTANYTAGYLGTFILGAAAGAILADGSGYWWPPYCYGGYYYPYPGTYCGAYYGGYGYHYPTPYYDSATGAYGWKQTAYGPYGSATRGAGYNPYTGTYARGASGFRLLMEVEAQRRHITLTLAPMLRPDRVRTRTLSGVVPTCREETRALPWAITQQRMEQSRAPLIRREEKWPLRARSGGTVRLVKLPAVICTPDTMVMCTRIRVTAGRSTIMEAGTQ